MPGCIDDYIHRIGRTARGMDGEAKLGKFSKRDAAFSAFHTVDIKTFSQPVEVGIFNWLLYIPDGSLKFCPSTWVFVDSTTKIMCNFFRHLT